MRLRQEDCRHRFSRARVARLGTVGADSVPHLVPVTFALIDNAIVFAVDHKPKTTTALRRLANIEAQPRVCFLADEYSDRWTDLWWVRADATALIVSGGNRFDSALDALTAKYVQYQAFRPLGPVVIATVDTWSGWTGG